MQAVVQARGIDKTQLSNGYREHQNTRPSKHKPRCNFRHGTEENSLLNEIDKQDDRIRLHIFKENILLTKAQLCCLKVSITNLMGLAMGQCGRITELLVDWNFLMIYWSLITTSMIKSRNSTVREAQ